MSGQKVALVTGSTSGIGLAVAQKLAADGYGVAINSFEPASAVGDAMSDIGAAGHYFQCDLSQAGAGARLVADVIGHFGRVDVVVNNAGIQKVSPIEDFPPEDWARVTSIILDAAFDTTRAAIPDMLSRGWGRIINVASAHGLVASPFKSAYIAAKHGVIGLTKTVALEMAEKGITANAICPGYVWTPLVERQLEDQMKVHGKSRDEVIRDIMLTPQPTKAFVTVEEIGALASFLCGDMARSITGTAISIDGGWTAK